MDYAGLDVPGLRYLVDRPLTEEERLFRYDQKKPSHLPAMDFLSVIKFNGNYIDLVDRWYPIKGFNVWLGGAIAAVCLFGVFVLIHLVINPPEGGHGIALAFLLFLVLIFSSFVYGGYWLMRTECGRWTHYPMRLNRKTRMVYVFRQNGTVLTLPWDRLFITRGEAKNPLAGTTYDLRAHVLDDDGVTVRESFSLGYSFLGGEDSTDKFWAFLQPYMEAPDGVERTYRLLKDRDGSYLLPLDGRKEGWRWSIVRTFGPVLSAPWAGLLMCMPAAWTATGRMLAMWTSKHPRWPKEVEQTSLVEPDDPYVLTWRDNPPLGWWDFGWPLVCTVIGWVATITIIWWLFSRLFSL